MGPKPVVARDPNEKSNPEAVRLVPLGGLEEVGRNCSFIEYKNEIVIIDMGLQFPEDETPGIDYIIPNIEYLEKKKQNIAGIILTHGHYDHIGALPHVLARIGNPPIYATSITKAIIEKRQDDFPNAPKMNIQIIKNGDEMKLSNNITRTLLRRAAHDPGNDRRDDENPDRQHRPLRGLPPGLRRRRQPARPRGIRETRQDGRAHFHGGQHERRKAGPFRFGKDRREKS